MCLKNLDLSHSLSQVTVTKKRLPHLLPQQHGKLSGMLRLIQDEDYTLAVARRDTPVILCDILNDEEDRPVLRSEEECGCNEDSV